MECKNHPGVAAMDRCAGCAEAFCYNCLVDVQGRKYCGHCKVMALSSQTPPPIVADQPNPYGSPYGSPYTPYGGPYGPYPGGYGQQACSEATEALIAAIIGLVLVFCCFAWFLPILALTKANEAKRKIAANPYLTGAGMATAAQVIAIVNLAFIALVILLNIISAMAEM